MIPLNQKVKIIYADSSNDDWGLPVKSPRSVTYRVRLDFNADAKLIQDDDGRDVIYSATLYFKGKIPLSYSDFIEYDSVVEGMVAVNPRVIFPVADLGGKISYTKVIV